MGRARSAFARPIRYVFGSRFDGVAARLVSGGTAADRDGPDTTGPTPAQIARQAALLALVDVSEHNREGVPPSFSRLTSQAASAAQCNDPRYLEWLGVLTGVGESRTVDNPYNRKVWEWAYIAEAVSEAGLVEPGRTALGFGVGNEPLPAFFASRGLGVIATDQAAESGGDWADTGQLMTGLSSLSRPYLITDTELASRVEVRDVDMNDVPADLGTFDVIWSSCVIEHLGSPERGLEFVLESCRMLAPGGIAVHTTELELTRRDTTADYGHCAVYRLQDLREFATRLADVGCTSSFNFTVPMDTREDRWISLALVDGESAPSDIAHLKLAIGDSVSTSFGLLIRRLP